MSFVLNEHFGAFFFFRCMNVQFCTFICLGQLSLSALFVCVCVCVCVFFFVLFFTSGTSLIRDIENLL